MYKLSHKCHYDIFCEEDLHIVKQFFDESILQFLVFLTIYNEQELVQYIKYVLIHIMKYESVPETVNKSKDWLTYMNQETIIDIWYIIVQCIVDMQSCFKKYSSALLMHYF